VSDALLRLVDKSMVEHLGEPDSAVGHYRLLESIRAFAAARLDLEEKDGAVAALAERHALHYLAVAREAESGLRTSEQQRLLFALDTGAENFHAALGYWMRSEGGQRRARALACHLAPYWKLRGRYSFGRELLERLIEGVAPEVAAPDFDGRELARARTHAGQLAEAMGDLSAAMAHYEEGLRLAERSGDDALRSALLCNAGTVVRSRGDYARARDLYTESLALARTLGLERTIAGDLGNLANVETDVGDYEAARALALESLELLERLGDRQGVAVQLNNLGNLARMVGDDRAAREWHERSLALRQSLDDRRGAALSLRNLGELARLEGRPEASRALLEESLAAYRDLGDRIGEAHARHELGLTTCESGELEEAREHLIAALSALWERGLRADVAEVLAGLAHLALVRGDAELCARRLGAVETLRRVPEARPNLERAAWIGAARAALGDGAFERALATGRAGTEEDAVASAFLAERTGPIA
jgi:tetratricopeptide (TPR) repeat protein